MADEEIRELERRWRATGAPEDEAALIAQRLRREGPTRRTLGAALLGYGPLPDLLPEAPRLTMPPEAQAHHETFITQGRIAPEPTMDLGASLLRQLDALILEPGLMERVGLATARAALPRWQELCPQDAWGETFVTSFAAWVANPARLSELESVAALDPAHRRGEDPVLDALADSLSRSREEGFTLAAGAHRALTWGRVLFSRELASALTLRKRRTTLLLQTHVPLGVWVALVGPAAALRALREGLGPWLLQLDDPLLTAFRSRITSTDPSGQRLPRTEAP